jgi:hypothetical protein
MVRQQLSGYYPPPNILRGNIVGRAPDADQTSEREGV